MSHRAITARAAARRPWAVLAGILTVAGASAEVFPMNPKSTFLHTSGDTPAAPLVIDLTTLRDVDGGPRLIQFTALGEFQVGPQWTDSYVSMLGVFSATPQVLDPSASARLPGAIDAGPDYISGPTWLGGQTTDISQDFAIGLSPLSRTITLEIPVDARYAIVGLVDSFYGDNADPDGNLAVAVNYLPEPASLVLLALGGLAGLRRSR